MESASQITQSEREAARLAFLEMEYTTLRKEIEDSRERGFRIIVGAVLAVPGAQFIAETWEIGIFKLFLPLIVLCFYLLWLAEHLAIGRCAEYMLTIEDRMNRMCPEVKGWEHWLAANSADRRAHEKYLGWAFNALSVGFYGAATLLAASALVGNGRDDSSHLAFNEYVSWPTPLLVLVAYTILGLVAAAFVRRIPRGWEVDRVQGERN
jgi:hypothetical protein